MTFNSIPFLIFFPVVTILYFILPFKFRWVLLLAASYLFYMYWNPAYIILIVISTLIDYYCALAMGRQKQRFKRKKYLWISLTANLGLLFIFKYFNFFSDSLGSLFNQLNLVYDLPHLNFLLPVGISFYTFQTLSYSIDVYRGIKEPEKHLGYFALYVSFFPQLVAGPIERSVDLLPQFFKKNSFDYNRIAEGLQLMLWGLFQKVVIADRLALFVNPIYHNPQKYTGFHYTLATVFFAFQILCDFSGYSNIAIGSAAVLGYKIRKNFFYPYFATSIRDFWQRWHISLSTWFKDYLYLPLGGNKVPTYRWVFNIITVFLISGLWHGANWTFVVWGMLHGFYFLIYSQTKKYFDSFVKFMRFEKDSRVLFLFKMLLTFMSVLFAWIFFRASNIQDAFYIIRHLGAGWGEIAILTHFSDESLFIYSCLMLIFLLIFIQYLQIRGSRLREKPICIRWFVYVMLALSIMNLGIDEEIPFIYFQF